MREPYINNLDIENINSRIDCQEFLGSRIDLTK